jgi:F0F1-type ATP synthase membrane subunit c/vacuolar-type H+-ATPase subunit K
MPKAHLFVKRICAILTLGIAFGLTACGGGGGGSGTSSSSAASGASTDPSNFTLPSSVSAIPPKN